jgi:hypothetical protein
VRVESSLVPRYIMINSFQCFYAPLRVLESVDGMFVVRCCHSLQLAGMVSPADGCSLPFVHCLGTDLFLRYTRSRSSSRCWTIQVLSPGIICSVSTTHFHCSVLVTCPQLRAPVVITLFIAPLYLVLAEIRLESQQWPSTPCIRIQLIGI